MVIKSPRWHITTTFGILSFSVATSIIYLVKVEFVVLETTQFCWLKHVCWTQCLLVKTTCLLNCLCLQATAHNTVSTPKLLPPLCFFTITTTQNFNISFTEEQPTWLLYIILALISSFLYYTLYFNFILQL